MKKENAIRIFEQKQIRTYWDEEQKKWYFSVVDVVGSLVATTQGNIGVFSKLYLKKEGMS